VVGTKYGVLVGVFTGINGPAGILVTDVEKIFNYKRLFEGCM